MALLFLILVGTEDNSISYFFPCKLYLTLEAYIVYYLSKFFNKKIGLQSDSPILDIGGKIKK